MSEIKPQVIVRSISISKRYGDDDRFTCSVSLQSPSGTIELKLPDERVNQVVALVADLVVLGTQEAMQGMTASAMQHTAIAHQPEPEEELDF